MPRATALTAQELLLLANLRQEGYTYTFHLTKDCIVCNETQECYGAETFHVNELHAYGRDKEERRLAYALEFNDGEKGVLMALSKDVNDIEDPTLYGKLLIV